MRAFTAIADFENARIQPWFCHCKCKTRLQNYLRGVRVAGFIPAIDAFAVAPWFPTLETRDAHPTRARESQSHPSHSPWTTRFRGDSCTMNIHVSGNRYFQTREILGFYIRHVFSRLSGISIWPLCMWRRWCTSWNACTIKLVIAWSKVIDGACSIICS